MNTKYEGLFRTENLKSFKKMLIFLLLAQKKSSSDIWSDLKCASHLIALASDGFHNE